MQYSFQRGGEFQLALTGWLRGPMRTFPLFFPTLYAANMYIGANSKVPTAR